MIELRKKALDDLQANLDDRMSERLKPPPEKKPEGEMPEEDGGEVELNLDLPEGADVSKLSPEERQQLEELYAKMGC